MVFIMEKENFEVFSQKLAKQEKKVLFMTTAKVKLKWGTGKMCQMGKMLESGKMK